MTELQTILCVDCAFKLYAQTYNFKTSCFVFDLDSRQFVYNQHLCLKF